MCSFPPCLILSRAALLGAKAWSLDGSRDQMPRPEGFLPQFDSENVQGQEFHCFGLGQKPWLAISEAQRVWGNQGDMVDPVTWWIRETPKGMDGSQSLKKNNNKFLY